MFLTLSFISGTEAESAAASTSSSTAPQPVQAPSFSIQSFANNAAEKNYIHLFNSTFDLVMGEKPFTDFSFIIKLQKRNGVTFMPGKDDAYSCAIFVQYLADAMRDDIQSILKSANFFSGEMDGSEARKTQEEKELIYTNVVIRGRPVELFLKCQRMTDFGGVDAKGTKAAFDAAFQIDFKVPQEKYDKHFVSVCADGAAVNMGRISGACTVMKQESRPWLVIVHCANHRLELAVADAFRASDAFKNLEEMFIKIYYLFRNSGKNKRIIKRIAEQLGVTWVSFKKTHGTRFQAHQYRGLKAMIVNFLSLLLFAENMIEGPKMCTPDVKAMLKGYHNLWISYGYLASLELYRKVLKLTSHVSLTFQNKNIIITDVIDTLEECKTGLHEIAAAPETEFPFCVEVNEESDEANLTARATNLPATAQFRERSRMTDKQKIQADKYIVKEVRETFTVKKVYQGKQTVAKIKRELIPSIVSCIEERMSSFQEPVYQAMRIVDHTLWDLDDDTYGKDMVKVLAEYFAEPLATHKFDINFALMEMSGVKKIKAMKFKGFKGKISFWEKIFGEFHHKFPHFLLVIEICLCLTFSSSTVERGFSTLKRHLTDARLNMKNKTLDNLLLLRINSPILNNLDPGYEDRLILKAVKKYMQDPVLKKGRYNKTSTKYSSTSSHCAQQPGAPDLFLPVSAAMYIAENPNDGLNELLVASDFEESGSESGEDSDSDTQLESVMISDHESEFDE